MHEISIAENIVGIAEASARDQNALSIRLIRMRLGEFTNIVPEALQFAFEIARQGTIAESAQLEIEIVRMTLFCVVCKAETQPARGVCLICGQCGFPLKIVAGEEMQIEYIDVAMAEERLECNQVSKEFQFRQVS